MATTNPVPIPNLTVRTGGSPTEKSTPFSLDFSAGTLTSYLWNPLFIQTQQLFGVPRSIYIDNSNGANAVTVNVSVTGMTISMPPFTQGIVPISASDNSTIILTSSGNTSNKAYVEIYNYEQRAVLWSTTGPYVPGQITAIDGEDGTNIMSPTNPVATAPKDCETVAYARVDLTTGGGNTALVAAGAIPLFITLMNAGDLTGATAGSPAYIKVGAAAVAEQGMMLRVGDKVTLPYRTKLAINGIVDAATTGTSILIETAH